MTGGIAYEPRPIGDPSWCCHGCGYQLEGLLPSQRCPECGTRCERLPGTQWQLFGDRRGYADLVRSLLTRPLRTMRSVRPDPWGERSRQLVFGHAVATMLALTAWPTVLAAVVPRSADGLVAAWTITIGGAGAVLFAAWWVMGAAVRAAGLPGIASPVRAHASAAWPIGGIVAAILLTAGVGWSEVRLDRGITTPWAVALPLAGVGLGTVASLVLAGLGTMRSKPASPTDTRRLAKRISLDRSRTDRRGRAFRRLAGEEVPEDQTDER